MSMTTLTPTRETEDGELVLDRFHDGSWELRATEPTLVSIPDGQVLTVHARLFTGERWHGEGVVADHPADGQVLIVGPLGF